VSASKPNIGSHASTKNFISMNSLRRHGCDARHAKKALDMKVNKTDANDAEGLAHLLVPFNRSLMSQQTLIHPTWSMSPKAMSPKD
jgi:hypothetical protein